MQILDLSNKPKVKGAKYFSAPINQLYHPLSNFPSDSQDIVYARDSFGIERFTPILLKEWFNLTAENGHLIIDYTNIDFQKLEKDMWWLWKNQYDIKYHGLISSNDLNN